MSSIFNKYKGMSVAAKAALAYMLASLFTKGLGIITTPLFTRVMSTAEIGEFNTFASWYSMIGVVATLSLSSGSFSLAMFEFEDKRDQYSSAMLGLSSCSAMVVGALYLCRPAMWNQLLSLNTIEMGIMFTAFLLIPATEYRIVRLRYEYNYKTLILITLTNAVMGTLLAIIAVLVAKYNCLDNLALYRIIGLYIVLCSMGLYNYGYLLKREKKVFNKTFWKFAAINNTPLIVNAFAKHVLEVSDRAMITNLVGKSETGIYSILYTVSTLSIIIWSAIEANLLPYMFDNLRNHTEEKINNIVNPLLIFFSVVCLFLTLCAPEIVRILATEEYYSSIYIMPPVACGVFFTAVYNIFGDVLLYHKKTYFIMISTIIAAISNIVLNYFGIKYFGFYAAAYTTLISYIILGISQFIAMKIVHPEKIFNIKFIVCISSILVSCSLCCMKLYDFFYIRYCILLAIAIIILCNRNKIISYFQIMKQKG